MGQGTVACYQAMVIENKGAQRALHLAIGNLGEMGSWGHPCPAYPVSPFPTLRYVQLTT